MTDLQIYSNRRSRATCPDMELAHFVLTNYRKPKGMEVIQAASDAFKVSIGELRGKTKVRRISNIRFVVYYLCIRLSGLSSSQVGILLGGRDHSTVLHGIQRVCKNYEKYRSIVLKTCKRIGARAPDDPVPAHE